MNNFLWKYAFKDLFRQKTRSYLGIFGITVSLFLLTTVSFATDSVSYSFINYLTSDSANQDMILRSRSNHNGNENSSEFFDFQEIENHLLTNFSEIDYILPRSYFEGYTWKLNQTSATDFKYYELWALNLTYEEQINYGKFNNLNDGIDLTDGISENTCLVDEEYASENGFQTGETIYLWLNKINATIPLEIVSTFEAENKFSGGQSSDIVVDMTWWGNLINDISENSSIQLDDWNGKANRAIIFLKNSEDIYDTRDVDGTQVLLSDLGGEILKSIGINDYTLNYPKLNILQFSEYLSLTMNIIFWVISFISMLVSGILINGILSTNVEERIREYGINRVLGAHKRYNLKLIVIQSSILCTIGTTFGILLSMIVSKFILVPEIEKYLIKNGNLTEISFIIQPSAILISYAIGIGVSMVVSIAPAIRVMRENIVSSINPYRTSDEVYKMKKEGRINITLVVVGLIFALNGGFVFFLIPRILLSLDFGLLAQVLIGTMLLFLIGVSLMALGLIPALLRILVQIFLPFHQKLMNIIKTTVHRHQRRNMSTVIMFVLSFSFIIFTTSMVEIQSAQVGKLIEYYNGSDIVVEPYFYSVDSPTLSIQEELMEIQGIERVSSLLASPGDLEDIYREQNKEFGITLGDFINYKFTEIRMYGIDKNFKETISDGMQEYIRFTEGDKNEAFDAVFNQSAVNIIISTHVANDLNLHLNDEVRLTYLRGTEQYIVVANIVGVAKNIPGLNRFREDTLVGGGGGDSGSADTDIVGGEQNQNGMSSASRGGGVIISDFNYINGMNIPEEAYIDQIFVSVQKGYDPSQIAEAIDNKFSSDYFLRVEVSNEGIEEAEENFRLVKYLFLVILIGTVIIAQFGLISSSYSAILERKREIGILRTLGLYGSGKVSVERMFFLENLILLLSSSTAGGIIGFLMAYGLSENMTLFSNTPRIIQVPWDIIAIIYAFSILFLKIGMKLLMYRLRNKNLIEIFRETI